MRVFDFVGKEVWIFYCSFFKSYIQNDRNEIESEIIRNRKYLSEVNKNWWQILRETKLANDCTTCILQRCAFYTWYYFNLVFFCLHACSEHEILREEIKSLQAVRSKLQQKIQDLEDELKKVKEDAEQSKATKVCRPTFFFPIKWLKMPISANWSIKMTTLV